MRTVAIAVSIPGTHAVLWSPDAVTAGPLPQIAAEVRAQESAAAPVRWVVWGASDLEPLLDLGLKVARIWDCAEVHRLALGGWAAGPQEVWAAVHDLPIEGAPGVPADDLFDFGESDDAPEPEALITPAGYLRADGVTGRWQAATLPDDMSRLTAWARAAYESGQRQQERLAGQGPRVAATAVSESAAALLCVELGRAGLPIDRGTMGELITKSAGPEPDSLETELAGRRVRDDRVRTLVPGQERTDLRNPAQVRQLLLAAGIDVPNTRKWTLEVFRDAHPVVPALLGWRADERIATTYGWRWLREHVGTDDRLRGRWTACDGAAGRMTAENGLHNLPAALRPGVCAEEGFHFVRADLGQIEPRVLAAVSGDAAFVAATQAADLYAPVAARLGVERSVAKVAVLAAMYGQRSGAAGEALAGLRRAYPTAMQLLEATAARGARGESVRTFGGRVVHTAPPQERGGVGPGEVAPPVAAARGRFARNAIIQGAAAELFKAWVATLRATTADLGAQIVLCLHDEVLIHVPSEHAPECARRVEQGLDDAARRWLADAPPVRFVADISIIKRWSEAT
ncbi:MAG: DNA polymerase [Actinomycetia bacterium]|nr:DNA polymerase [Actinomycetes bacterium]